MVALVIFHRQNAVLAPVSLGMIAVEQGAAIFPFVIDERLRAAHRRSLRVRVSRSNVLQGYVLAARLLVVRLGKPAGQIGQVLRHLDCLE